MPNESTQHPAQKFMVLLSRLLFPPNDEAESARLTADVSGISREDFDDLVNLANLNHVVVRGLEAFLKIVCEANDDTRADWATAAIETELARINLAIPFLHNVCKAFDEEGLNVAVIKSLDHWPDLGSDLDLYTSATP